MGKFIELLSSRFSGITLWDVLDIIILAALFFSVYGFVRKRRAFSALIGTAVFIGVRFAVKALGLAASMEFFDFFYNFGAIVIIVVFQADIRSMLEKLGSFVLGFRRNIVKLLHPKSECREVEELIKAVTRLSSDRTGALIVFEGSGGLGEVTDKGVKIDALISSELVRNLFFSPAPLHDGAIVIRGKRVYAAACMLPSYTDPVSSEFGSRHRAAIGMSHSSDAIVIVVSEETGIISCAVGGELHTGYTAEQMRKTLNFYYGVRVKKTKEEKQREKQNKLNAKKNGKSKSAKSKKKSNA